MNYFTIYGAALLLALLIASPALDRWNFKPFGDWKPRSRWRDFWASELGAVSVTYYTRAPGVAINGSLTPITAAQAQQCMKQSAIVVFGVTGDIAATFTHNWGLDISANTYIEPEIFQEFLSTALTTFQPLITWDRSNTNAVFINKPATADACTMRVTLRRPHSMGQ